MSEVKIGSIGISIAHADIAAHQARVVVLKYAQSFYGADLQIAERLAAVGIGRQLMTPRVGQFSYLDTLQAIAAPRVLFVGVQPLWNLTYEEVASFSEKALVYLSQKAPKTPSVAMTIHGPGYGLDESVAFLALLSGLKRAVSRGRAPTGLTSLTIVEMDQHRSQRLNRLLEGWAANDGGPAGVIDSFPQGESHNRLSHSTNAQSVAEILARLLDGGTSRRRHSVTSTSDSDAAFVAMPFAPAMEDVFYYGIQRAAHANGLLCERIDQASFTGDILVRIKNKIQKCRVLIADLSDANPNVYLEVGYAWGAGKQTILLVKDIKDLKFDVQGQRCLRYTSIRNLEESLTHELSELRKVGWK